MKEKVTRLLEDVLAPLNLFVDDAFIEKVDGITSLCIVLDSEEIIDLNRITEASKIINPIMDEANLIEEGYVLDIYSKEKGEVTK